LYTLVKGGAIAAMAVSRSRKNGLKVRALDAIPE
jgi:hypothetical protein